jgi:NAD(P)-dependent dehydrogenase (short-subunit alcohol dehydrogenase family)
MAQPSAEQASTQQQPIKSGFGRDSTASDVLAGIDLSGKFAIVTGGYSGMGLEITRALSAAGAKVLVPARRPAQAREALAGLAAVEVDELDLGDLESVKRFAKRVVDRGRSVDILINNAGIFACPETRIGPGWEAQFATNHLGHFALTNAIWPLLTAGGGARVVMVSSGAHKIAPVNFDDLQLEHGYDKYLAYAQSKTANVLFAIHLDALGRDSDVRAFAVHPGAVISPAQRHLTREEMVTQGWIDADGTPADWFQSTEQGAATATWAATSPALAGKGGLFCEECDVAALTPPGSPKAIEGVDGYAIDPEIAERLWAVSAQLTGVDAFAKTR